MFDDKLFELLLKFVESAKIKDFQNKMSAGEIVNFTEVIFYLKETRGIAYSVEKSRRKTNSCKWRRCNF